MHCHTARIAFLSPKSFQPQRMPCVVHLAGTGGHLFEQRLRLGGPLLKESIATMVLERTMGTYIPKHSVLELQKAWPGSEVRWVSCSHVSSFLLHNGEFRRAIVDGLDRLQWKESPS